MPASRIGPDKAVEWTEFGDQALEICFTSARDRESRTPRRQFASDRATDACFGAGNESASTFESHAQHPDPLAHCYYRNVYAREDPSLSVNPTVWFCCTNVKA